MPARTLTRRRAVLIGAALVTAFALISLVAGLVRSPGVEPVAVTAELVTAVMATAACLLTAARCQGPRRRAWSWWAAGTGAWALGEAWWAAEELIAGGTVSVPSPADVGFLLLPVCAIVAILVHPAARLSHATERLLMLTDGVMITMAIALVAWQFPISALVDPAAAQITQIIALAYPFADLLVVALLCAVLASGGRRRRHLFWLLAAVLMTSAADGVFSRATQAGAVTAASIADVLWIGGFLAIIMAARAEPGDDSDVRPPSATVSEILPYVLILIVGAVVVSHRLTEDPVDSPTAAIITALVLLTLLRQRLLLLDNRRLQEQLDQGRAQLRHRTVHDPVTDLPNRNGFLELTDRALARHPDQPFAVARLRLYQTEALDHLPTDESDAVLAGMAEAMRRGLPEGHRLARVDDKAFALLIPGDRADAVSATQNAMLALEDPLMDPGHRPHARLTAGISITRAGDAKRSAAALLREAAIALSRSAAVPGAITVLTPAMLQEHSNRLALRNAVISALRAEPASGVEVLFEPVVELAGGGLAGVAARASWREEPHGTVSAGRLTQIAREAGLTGRVDNAVIDTALALFGGWNRRWPDTCGELWITVCTETLAGERFPERLRRSLEVTGVPTTALVLELLDGVDGFDTRACGAEARRNLRRLRRTGMRFAAGGAIVLSGYAGGPKGPDDADADADYYDIPPLLVSRCVEDVRARRLVQATAEFAVSRGASTAARQVITAEQHEELLEAGCTVARGPLYGSSMPDDQVEEVLAAVAAGTWRTGADLDALRHRSSRAWQELRQVISELPVATFACDVAGKVILAEGALLPELTTGADPVDRPVTALFGDGRRGGHEAGQGDAGRGDAEASRTGPGLTGRNHVGMNGPPLAGALDAALGGRSEVTTVPVRDRWIQVHLRPGRDQEGRITGALGVAIDVTHRVLIEHALRDSEQQFKSVFEHAPVGMAIIGPSSELQHANEALARMLGRSARELEGHDVIEMRHPDSPPEAEERYEDLLAGRIAQYHQEHAFRHRDGSPVWVRVSVVPLAGAGVAPGTLIAIVEDRSRLKQMEVRLRQAHRLEAVGMLAAGIAHEIDMPIRAVRDNLSFLSDTCATLIEALSGAQRLSAPPGEDASGRLERLLSPLGLPSLREEVPSAARQSLEGVARITSIVSAIQGFGRPDPSEPTPIDINAAVRDTTTVARNEYKYVADMELDLGDIPTVPGYPSLFHQALLNLVVNAAQAIDDAVAGTERRGTIRIATTADADHVHVTVTDDGVGMQAEVQEHIFEPYFTTKDASRGTGQGLAMVHSVIVQQHNGAIRVESTPGDGATFVLTLPLHGAAGASSAGGFGRDGAEVPGRPPSGHPLEAGSDATSDTRSATRSGGSPGRHRLSGPS